MTGPRRPLMHAPASPRETQKPRHPLGIPGPSLSGGRDSNPRPRAWEARALPTELPPRDRRLLPLLVAHRQALLTSPSHVSVHLLQPPPMGVSLDEATTGAIPHRDLPTPLRWLRRRLRPLHRRRARGRPRSGRAARRSSTASARSPRSWRPTTPRTARCRLSALDDLLTKLSDAGVLAGAPSRSARPKTWLARLARPTHPLPRPHPAPRRARRPPLTFARSSSSSSTRRRSTRSTPGTSSSPSPAPRSRTPSAAGSRAPRSSPWARPSRTSSSA